MGAGVDTVDTLTSFGAEAAGAGAGSGSSSLSGCSISRSFAFGSAGGVRDLGVVAVAGAVLIEAGAGAEADGAVSDRVGAGEEAGAGAGVEADLVGAAGMGADEEDTDRVSRSMTFGRAVLPPNHSSLESDGSIEFAGGKMLKLAAERRSIRVLTLTGSSRPFGGR